MRSSGSFDAVTGERSDHATGPRECAFTPTPYITQFLSCCCHCCCVPSLKDPSVVTALIVESLACSAVDTENGRSTGTQDLSTRSKHRMRVSAPLLLPCVPTGIRTLYMTGLEVSTAHETYSHDGSAAVISDSSGSFEGNR